MSNTTYLVAGIKSWHRECFDRELCRLPGTWHFVGKREELSPERLKELQPRYLFFLHWSWIVPSKIIRDYECVCFHMTDVPYGRGGSPLQNLIIRGHDETMLTALRMVEELDAGPVYLKKPLSLDGRAEEIYVRATDLSVDMIRTIIQEEPTPTPQEGPETAFTRRKPHESRISEIHSLDQLYDFIRMLDAEGYPHAFINHQHFRIEFTHAELKDSSISASVRISTKTKETEL